MATRGRPKRVVPEKTDAQKWLEKISRAKKVREEWLNSFRVSLGYEYYEGRQRPSWVSEEDWITLNKVYSNLEAILPSLYSVDPYFYIKLKRSFKPDQSIIAKYETKAHIRQAFLNYLKGELRLKAKGRLSIKDAFFQYGIIKVHLSADLQENEKAGNPIIGEDGHPVLDPKTREPQMEPDLIPANKRYRLSRIHPSDFLVDEDAGPDDDDVKWKAHRVKMSLEKAKKDLRFPKEVRDNLKATEIKDEAEKDRENRKKGLASNDAKGKNPDVVVTWEVYDRENSQWFILAEGNEAFLIEPGDIPAGTEQDPFVDLRFTLRDDSWYPIPAVSQWIDPQRDYCQFRSKLHTHLKRFNRKYEMDMSAFDKPEEAAAQLKSGDDGTVLQKSRATGFNAVSPIADAPLDQQLHTALAYLNMDFAEIAVGSNQRNSGQGVDSATEAGIIEKREIIREGDRVALVQDFVIDIGRKTDQLVQAHITEDQAIKVSGPQGEDWQTVRKSDYEEIAGEYEYTVNVGATTPQLPEIERAQWTAFLTLIASAPQLLLSKTLLTETARMFHIENEQLVNELYDLGQKIMDGQVPMPGTQGSAPGSGTPASPMSAMGAGMGMNNVRGGKQ